ncbi:MAG: NAD(P)H-binding protein, partial [Actinoplanes sp.]
MGATGNTGRKITELLLEDGQEVRALGRSPEKLAKLDALGAETVAGDVRDA